MKKFLVVAAIATSTIFMASCGNNNAGSEASKTDSSANVTNPPDNSDATNPSLADTAYSGKDSTKMRKDSSKMNPR